MKKINRLGFEYYVLDNTKNSFFWDIESWEIDNYQILKDESKNHSVFVHAGGWIGPFTLFAANLYEKVFCLEPDPEALKELMVNIKYNKYDNVYVEGKAFLDSEKEIIIGTNSSLGQSITNIFQESNGVLVKTTTLKNFFQKNNIPKYSFLMLDVEGSEYLLFDDYEFYENYKPTLLISFHFSFLNDENFQRMLNSLSRLKTIYNIDIDELTKLREQINFGTSFKEINRLYKLI